MELYRMDNGEVHMTESEGKGTIGMILARTASSSERPVDALALAQDLLAAGKQVGVFLVGDGIYLAKDGGTEAARIIKDLISKGAKVYVSPEHLKASGLSKERLVEGVAIVEDTYRDLVEFVMEWHEKVIVC